MQLDGENFSPAAGPSGRADKAIPRLPAAGESGISELIELGVSRRHYVKASIRVTNQVGGLLRRALGFTPPASRDTPLDAEQKKIVKRASTILAAALARKPQREENQEIAAALEVAFDVARQMAEPANVARHAVEMEMRRIARKLPVWRHWGKGIKGFSDLALAIIVAEAGDLSRYPDAGPARRGPGKLWRRLGLAPFTKDGVTRSGSQWKFKDDLDKADWGEFGYSGKRRAQMFAQVGGPLIGAMNHGPRPFVGEDVSLRVASGEWTKYQAMFVQRLRHEAAKDPEQRRPDTEDGKESYSKCAARKAQYYVEKKFLRDLWKEWRRAKGRVRESANEALPAAALT